MGSFITERSDESADEEDDGEPPKVLFQRVLKHNILQVLPSVVDASLRLQAIWILAQFVVSSDLQKVLLGLVLQRLGKTDTQAVVSNERFAKSQHVGIATRLERRLRSPWREAFWRTTSRPRTRTWSSPTCCCAACSTSSATTRSWRKSPTVPFRST